MTTEATPGALGSNDQLGPLLEDALGAYWDAAYAEGRSRRTHDTEDGAAQTALLQVRVAVAALVAAERERWQRIATNAQAVTNGGEDRLDYFEVPSHLMAALALALDEGPNLCYRACLLTRHNRN